MSDIWLHPGFQAGVAPAIVVFILLIALATIRGLAGLTIIAGFAVTVALTTGFSFEPLTSTRKILLLALLSPVFGAMLEWARMPKKVSRGLVVTVAAVSIIWVVWPYVTRADIENGFVIAVGLAIFSAWMCYWFYLLADRPLWNGSAILMTTGLGVGASSLFGASALLGQWGISIGSGGIAALVVSLIIKRSAPAGSIFVVSGGLVLALIGAAAVIYAKLPWYVLAVLAVIPVLGQLRMAETKSKMWQIAVVTATSAVVAAAAVFLTRMSEGDIPV